MASNMYFYGWPGHSQAAPAAAEEEPPAGYRCVKMLAPTPAQSVSGCGLRGPAWTSGSGRGAPVGSLLPSARHVKPSTPAALLELAAALKRKVPARTAAQVAAIPTEHGTAMVPSADPTATTERTPAAAHYLRVRRSRR